jgi:hypothetical protein
MNGVQLLDYAVELSEPALWFCFAFFLWRNVPSNAIQRLYPYRVRLLWSLPFTSKWQKNIAPEHLAPVRRYRTGFFAYSAAIFILILLRWAYYEFLFVKLHSW